MTPDERDFSLDGLTITLPIVWETVDDDDGCGSPDRTGNHLTGCRGSYWVAEIGYLSDDDCRRIAEKIAEYCKTELADLEHITHKEPHL